MTKLSRAYRTACFESRTHHICNNIQEIEMPRLVIKLDISCQVGR